MTMIRTEIYKLITFRKFRKNILLLAGINFVVMTLILAFFDDILALAEQKPEQDMIVTLEGALSEPFPFALLMVIMFVSAVSFLYMDFANGYVKNIVGQIRSKNSYVIAKLIAVAVSNLFFFLASTLTYILSAVVTGRFEVGENIGGGVATLLIKWLLSVALCSILLFLSVGIKNHTLSVIIAVVFSTNALSLLYLGVNYGIHEMFKLKDFDITHYSPSSLMSTVDVVKGDFVVNALVVSAVFIALFVYLTCVIFKKRDIH